MENKQTADKIINQNIWKAGDLGDRNPQMILDLCFSDVPLPHNPQLHPSFCMPPADAPTIVYVFVFVLALVFVFLCVCLFFCIPPSLMLP